MLSDEAPFSIVNVACHGCQDEMRSTGDTHELETRQLVLCISVIITFPIFFFFFFLNVNDWLLGLSFNIGAGGGV